MAFRVGGSANPGKRRDGVNNAILEAAIVRALLSLNPSEAGLRLADWIMAQENEVRDRAIRLLWVCSAALEGVSDGEV